MTVKVILVRHGQTEWNKIERFRGRYNIPLNQTGIDQATKTGIRISNKWKPIAIYSSPMGRAMQTAVKIAEFCKQPVFPCDGLNDIDYGEWQGLTPEEVNRQWPDLLKVWYEMPEMAYIPGGESLTQVRERAMASIMELCQKHPDSNLVLVSHTVVIRMILLAILGAGKDHFWRISQEPCAINVFEVQNNQYRLVSFNDTCHLD
ncbi:MAG: histidine phosphatase family protein [Leptolinea sp.]|jgi:broad specificity phosphatase PhoE|nr:histidine phosphatase family protein [Leptolinea sp.]